MQGFNLRLRINKNEPRGLIEASIDLQEVIQTSNMSIQHECFIGEARREIGERPERAYLWRETRLLILSTIIPPYYLHFVVTVPN